MKTEGHKNIENKGSAVPNAILDHIASLSKDEMIERLNWTPDGFEHLGANFSASDVSSSPEGASEYIPQTSHRLAVAAATVGVIGAEILVNHIRKK